MNVIDSMFEIIYSILPHVLVFLGFIVSMGVALIFIKRIFVNDTYSYSSSINSGTYSRKVNLDKSSYSNSSSSSSSSKSSSVYDNTATWVALSSSYDSSSSNSYDSGSSCSHHDSSSSFDSGCW